MNEDQPLQKPGANMSLNITVNLYLHTDELIATYSSDDGTLPIRQHPKIAYMLSSRIDDCMDRTYLKNLYPDDKDQSDHNSPSTLPKISLTPRDILNQNIHSCRIELIIAENDEVKKCVHDLLDSKDSTYQVRFFAPHPQTHEDTHLLSIDHVLTKKRAHYLAERHVGSYSSFIETACHPTERYEPTDKMDDFIEPHQEIPTPVETTMVEIIETFFPHLSLTIYREEAKDSDRILAQAKDLNDAIQKHETDHHRALEALAHLTTVFKINAR